MRSLRLNLAAIPTTTSSPPGLKSRPRRRSPWPHSSGSGSCRLSIFFYSLHWSWASLCQCKSDAVRRKLSRGAAVLAAIANGHARCGGHSRGSRPSWLHRLRPRPSCLPTARGALCSSKSSSSPAGLAGGSPLPGAIAEERYAGNVSSWTISTAGALDSSIANSSMRAVRH